FFFVGLSVVPKGFLQKIPKIQEKEAFKEIFHFSKWLLLSFVATTIASRLDLLLLSRIKGSTEVGLYAVALQLASVMPLLTGAITTVLLPRVSQMRQQQEFISYIKKVLLGSGVLVLVLLPMVFLGDSLINLFFGSRFNGSMAPFKVIFISYLLALIINPVGQIIYALNRPQVFTALNYVQLALSVALNLLLIPKFGIMGAALTILLLHILGGVFIGGYVAKIVKEVPS
ncbi:MAG TPA: oligosaccharide flippase family protein, partial [Candidatus Saccharimonadales bacterium]|nr:oligosaccharide flippase family protein [Candidatus Saccharimonadales bacterium]